MTKVMRTLVVRTSLPRFSLSLHLDEGQAHGTCGELEEQGQVHEAADALLVHFRDARAGGNPQRRGLPALCAAAGGGHGVVSVRVAMDT
jgi:hypothetical protein